MENTKENIGKVLVELKSAIKPHLERKDLVTDGILDSLDIMRLITELENNFEIEIDPEDIISDNFESVDAISALIQKCRG